MRKEFIDFLDFLKNNIFWVLLVFFILFRNYKAIKKDRKKKAIGAAKEESKPSGTKAILDLSKIIGQISAFQKQAESFATGARLISIAQPLVPTKFPRIVSTSSLAEKLKLRRNTKYLQIALNSTLGEAKKILFQLPKSERILIEAGTPLVKRYGIGVISEIRNYVFYNSPGLSQNLYIVADLKCADLAQREVEMAARAGASAVTCLGVAPLETINSFVEECEKSGIDSMVDMMNVENPLLVLRQLKKQPAVVIIHRGVDETEINKEKLLPYYQINQIKGNSNVLIAVAGGDTIKEIQSTVFNGANIVVLWKAFYEFTGGMEATINEFLKEIR